MYYLLYTKKGCSYCEKALNLLHANRKEYVVNECDDTSKSLLEVKEKHNWDTVPLIFECLGKGKKVFIGGYDDLVKYLETSND